MGKKVKGATGSGSKESAPAVGGATGSGSKRSAPAVGGVAGSGSKKSAPAVGGAAAGSSSRRAGPARPRGSVGRAAEHVEEEADSYTHTYPEDERPAVGRAAAPVELTESIFASESDSNTPWRRR